MELENNTFSLLPLASSTKRIIGNILTSLLFVIWVFFLLNIVGFFTRSFEINEFQADEIAISIWLFSVISYLGLQIYTMLKYQKTISKKILGIQVVDWETRQALSFKRYFAREMVEWLFSLFIPIIPLINLIMLFANKERRTLSDILFTTCVIEKK